MMNSLLLPHLDFLLGAALSKCGNMEDARDLTQETLLCALTFLQKGGTLSDPRGWLLTTLNRRYCDWLRKKYRYPTVTIGEEFADERDGDGSTRLIAAADEAAAIRREVAYLSDLYRTILVRRYFYGESVRAIATRLKIPEGTVKSRLAYARGEMKNGLNDMDAYTQNSYTPERLGVSFTGRAGGNWEPMSLIRDDLLAENLLILAYDKPVTVSELARAIGVPAAYIEPILHKLVEGELMKRVGDNKGYTDFIIYDEADHVKYLADAEAFAAENAEVYCEPMRRAIAALKNTEFYSARLERFMIIKIAQKLMIDSVNAHMPPQVFPDRPNGGAWIAFGTRYSPNDRLTKEQRELCDKYQMSGERWTRSDEYLGSHMALYSFETSLCPVYKYKDFQFTNFGEMEINVLRLYSLIQKGISPESVGYPVSMLKNMPLMQEHGLIAIEEGKPRLLIPCLTHEQYDRYDAIVREAVDAALPVMREKIGIYINARKKPLPPHLKSVPEQKRIFPYEPSPMVLVYEAIARGVHPHDIGELCPETIMVMD